MDNMIRNMMVNMRKLAKLLKDASLSEPQIETLRQTILNGQVLLAGLSVLKERLVNGTVAEGDEYLIAFFSGEAEQYIRQTTSFTEEMSVVHG